MATKKYEVGGMTDECAGPGGPGKKKKCRQKFKSKGASQETKGSVLGTIGAGILGALGYGAYKKLKKEQKGGATKYKTGGAKKPLRKAKDGEPVGPYMISNTVPKSKDKNIYEGPLTERDTKQLDENYPATVGKGNLYGRPAVVGNKKQGYISNEASEKYYRRNDENYLRSNDPTVQKWNANQSYTGDYPGTSNPNFKKGGAKKMKTGGMVNPNAKLQAAKAAGSKGVKSGVNPKAAASKVARGRSGGTSAAPKTATPKAKYGMTMKKYGEGGGTKSGSSMYNIKQSPAKTPTGSRSTMNPVKKAKAKYGMTVKRKK